MSDEFHSHLMIELFGIRRKLLHCNRIYGRIDDPVVCRFMSFTQ
jgi:hypothetical protein